MFEQSPIRIVHMCVCVCVCHCAQLWYTWNMHGTVLVIPPLLRCQPPEGRGRKSYKVCLKRKKIIIHTHSPPKKNIYYKHIITRYIIFTRWSLKINLTDILNKSTKHYCTLVKATRSCSPFFDNFFVTAGIITGSPRLVPHFVFLLFLFLAICILIPSKTTHHNNSSITVIIHMNSVFSLYDKTSSATAEKSQLIPSWSKVFCHGWLSFWVLWSTWVEWSVGRQAASYSVYGDTALLLLPHMDMQW